MKAMYIMLLGGSLILGILDGGDITAFMIFCIFGIAYGADKLLCYAKRRVRKCSITHARNADKI